VRLGFAIGEDVWGESPETLLLRLVIQPLLSGDFLIEFTNHVGCILFREEHQLREPQLRRSEVLVHVLALHEIHHVLKGPLFELFRDGPFARLHDSARACESLGVHRFGDDVIVLQHVHRIFLHVAPDVEIVNHLENDSLVSHARDAPGQTGSAFIHHEFDFLHVGNLTGQIADGNVPVTVNQFPDLNREGRVHAVEKQDLLFLREIVVRGLHENLTTKHVPVGLGHVVPPIFLAFFIDGAIGEHELLAEPSHVLEEGSPPVGTLDDSLGAEGGVLTDDEIRLRGETFENAVHELVLHRVRPRVVVALDLGVKLPVTVRLVFTDQLTVVDRFVRRLTTAIHDRARRGEWGTGGGASQSKSSCRIFGVHGGRSRALE